jgi:hypothetical protein
MPETAVQTAIAEWRDKQIDGTQLMRRLVSFNQWMLPVSEAAAAEMMNTGTASRLMYSQDEHGISRLYLFSDGEAYRAFQQATGEETTGQHFLTTTGAWIFHLPMEQFDAIEIDPASPWQISYRQEQFTALRAMADAVEVEQALVALRLGQAQPGMITLVRNYKHYLLAVFDRGDGFALALAPDDKGRELAALFTSRDNFSAFLDGREARPEEGLLLQLELAGPELFAQLSQMHLDGLVFNCRGPARAVAFALPFASVVLEAKPGE